ncbi:hypothetical protein GGR24_001444 [Hansschlegelia beijingensis]|uniref:Uncharacterized protein n=1 Tax=Hansschlegelia beijingensis TaxID=1133344 RepID=A0A7W6CYR9_9HYPH|nr:hypothetical protein [Hansschlegelia beijingensis]MBB3972787.1 hypothetical protein [Hansschlegelia beijingensis]
MKREGGLVALVSRAAAAHGLSPTDAPGAGDVGVVRGAIEWRGRVLRPPTAAVCVGPARWALLTEARGVAIADLPVLSAWSV